MDKWGLDLIWWHLVETITFCSNSSGVIGRGSQSAGSTNSQRQLVPILLKFLAVVFNTSFCGFSVWCFALNKVWWLLGHVIKRTWLKAYRASTIYNETSAVQDLLFHVGSTLRTCLYPDEWLLQLSEDCKKKPQKARCIYLLPKRGQLTCWIVLHSSNKLTLIAPYLPTDADPWSPLHCFSLYTAEDL